MTKRLDSHPEAIPAWTRRALLLVALGPLLLVACHALSSVFGGGNDRPRFPHAIHLDEGLECTSCHAGAETQGFAGFPADTAGCMLCHQQIDAEKPTERTVAAFLLEGKPRWLREPSYPADVRFDHRAHAAAEVPCSRCHQTESQLPIAEDETESATATEAPVPGSDLRVRGGKPECLACHANTQRGNDCAVCHSVLRKDQPPPDHGHNWKQLHGSRIHTLIAGLGETTCEQCHQQQDCQSCHQEELPRDHTSFWRRRGHGLTAGIDRSRCSTCHQPDYCERCHQETKPISHTPSFGGVQNRHCISCHLPPAAGLGCGTCHKSFPAHPTAIPTPGNAAHLTARSPADCLSCHLTLRHQNPGGDCRTCHQ